jgi:hypothetical protein
MRFVTQMLDGLVGGLGLQLEPWMAPVFAVALALLVMPAWRRNFKTKQARKRILELGAAPVQDRAQMRTDILALVEGNPFGQVVVVEEAMKRHQNVLAAEALERLEISRKRRDEARRLRLKLSGERPTTPEAEALAIERLREAGLDDAATARLHAAQQRWPHHPSLR